jgi:hypothetical protein
MTMGKIEEQPLVEVFRTEDPALLPLAVATLDQASVEYAIRSTNEGIPVGYGYRPGLGETSGPAVLLVREADEARARGLLSDLKSAALTGDPLDSRTVPAPAGAPVATRSGPRNVSLTDVASGALLGEISDEQLQFLVDELEEESADDQDYFIDSATIDLLEKHGGDAELIAVLRNAVGTGNGLDVAWTRR